MQTVADESGRLVIELHGAMQDLDPARWKRGRLNQSVVTSLRERLEQIRERLTGLTEDAPWEEDDALRVHLVEVRDVLEAVPDRDGSLATARSAWMAFRSRMEPRYEAARSALRGYAIHVPSLRPTNHVRSLFHALMATGTIAILFFLPDPAWGIAVILPFLVWGWSMEWLRRRRPELNAKLMRAFGPVAHPHETRRVNSATWYVTAIFLLSLTRSPIVCAIGLAVLGFGDPAGALIGRRFGRVKLMHGRTLEGTLAFFVVGTLVGFGVACWFAAFLAPTTPWPLLLAVSAAGGAGGAFAELISLRIDDNLSVPIVASVAAGIAAMSLGVPLG